MLSRLAATPAILGLLLCAGLAGVAATRLRVTGAWTMWATCAVLVVVAVGLLARQLWGYLFGLVFCTVCTLGLGTLTVVVVWQGATDRGGSGWASVATILILGIAVVGAIACGASALAGLALVAGWRATTRSRSAEAWVVGAFGALVGVALVGWLVGYRYVYLKLPAQDRCLSSTPRTCSMLIRDARRYPKAQRMTFAVHGCRAGDDTVCRELVELLEPAHTAASAEALAVDARCQAGNPDMCRRLGAHLARIGDAEEGTRRLERACAIDARWCDEAAKAASEVNLPGLPLRLLEQGCERDDASSCRRLLRETGKTRPDAEVAALELKTCLLGDVNDCKPLIRRDLTAVCAPVCEGTSDNRMQTCRHCAREAEAAGERGLAEQWLGAMCQKGRQYACDELARLRSASAVSSATSRSRPGS